MTNEELAALIQSGESDRMLELWAQNRGLCYLKARQVSRALEGQGRCDADLDDLMQAGYLALVDAVEQYNPASGFKFSTVYTTRLKSYFAEAAGYRSKKQQKEPLHTAGSLDTPLDDEPEGATLGDLIADPLDQYEAVDERLYREWLRDFLNTELEKLAPEPVEAPKDRDRAVLAYIEAGHSYAEAGAQFGLSKSWAAAAVKRARQREKDAGE